MKTNELMILAFDYVSKNPERFNDREKSKFFSCLNDWINGKTKAIDDEVYDFLVAVKVLKEKTRHEEFAGYINNKYGHLHFRRIMDVGAGRMCHLSELLAKQGARVTAMDPNIRLSMPEIFQRGIAQFSRDKFICDKYATMTGKGTNIEGYDLIVGLEPCDATEHIIHQGLKYDVPFEVLLCGAPHDGLDGSHFYSYEAWYDYLRSISSEVHLKKYNGSYIATNNNDVREMEREL